MSADITQKSFLVGGWTFHVPLYRLERGQQSIKLEPRVGQLLTYLVNHAGTPISRETLMDEVWPDTVVGDEALNNTVNKLRRAFDDDSHHPRVIETLPKIGYRLIAKVEASDSVDFSVNNIANSANQPAAKRHWLKPVLITASLAVLATVFILLNVAYFLPSEQQTVPAVSLDHIELTSEQQGRLTQNSVKENSNEREKSIAVLPFENLNQDPDQDYFSDGITDDLITDLSNISGLSVISRNSVFTFKGRAVKVQQIASELGASHILEGSIRRVGNRVRINAQFIDAATGHHLWAERYDRDLTNVFELQDEITQKIVTALQIKLTEQERSGLQKRYTNSVEAYDLFLKGQQEFLKYTREGNSEARKYFQMATELDPEYARSLANLGWTYARDFQDGWASSPEESLDKALELVLKAKSLDQTSSRIHWILGQVFLYKREYKQAIESVQKAINLSPGNPDPKILLARILIFSGDPVESIRLINDAIRSNPLYPMQYQMNLGIAHFTNEDYEKAEKALVIASERNPDAQRVRMWLVATYANAGDLDAASWEFDELLMINPEFSIENLQHSIPFRNESIRDRLFRGLQNAASQ